MEQLEAQEMPHEEQTEWPSFETILREVAPNSPTLHDDISVAPGHISPDTDADARADVPQDDDDPVNVDTLDSDTLDSDTLDSDTLDSEVLDSEALDDLLDYDPLDVEAPEVNTQPAEVDAATTADIGTSFPDHFDGFPGLFDADIYQTPVDVEMSTWDLDTASEIFPVVAPDTNLANDVGTQFDSESAADEPHPPTADEPDADIPVDPGVDPAPQTELDTDYELDADYGSETETEIETAEREPAPQPSSEPPTQAGDILEHVEAVDQPKPDRVDSGSIVAMLRARSAARAEPEPEIPVPVMDLEPTAETTPAHNSPVDPLVDEAPETAAHDIAPAPDPQILTSVDDEIFDDEIPTEPLNPFAPDFAGIADEIVEDDDDGWITHSLHDIGNPVEPAPAPQQAPAAPHVHAQAPPAGTAETPFTNLFPEPGSDSYISTASFDTSGLDTTQYAEPFAPEEEFVAPELGTEFAQPTVVERSNPEPIQFEPITYNDPELVEYEDPTTTFAEPAADVDYGSDLWNLDDDPAVQNADIIPFRSPDTPPHAVEPAPAFNPTQGLYPTDPAATEQTPHWAHLDEGLDEGLAPAHPAPERQAPASGVNDPWAYIRPKDEPEKITFWANRPKFFGGDERRKARARREARRDFDQETGSASTLHTCPKCRAASPAEGRVSDSGRALVRCTTCEHMWFVDS